MVADIAEEKQRGITAHAPLAGHGGQGGVDLGQAVHAAAGILFAKAEKNIEARSVMLVIAVKGGDKHGGIEESLHCSGFSGAGARTLLADIAQRFAGLGGGQRLACAEHPDAAFLL